MISLYRLESYEEEPVRQAVFALFDRYFPAHHNPFLGKRVLLKPNLLMRRRPEEATTTHPAIIRAAAEAVRQRGAASLLLADSPGGPYQKAWVSGIYHTCGMQQCGVPLNEGFGHHLAAYPEGQVCRQFDLIDAAAQADVIVNLAKMKTHAMTAMSGGVKNLFGTVAGLQKPGMHYQYPKLEDFCGMLVDLSLLLRPVFTLVDGVEAMEGNGPSGGQVRRTGLLLAGEDVWSLDRVLCHLMGFAPEQVGTVAQSIRRGLCPERLEDIPLDDPEGLCAPIPGFRHPDSVGHDFSSYVPGFLQRPFRFVRDRWLLPHPVIDTARCIGCGKCAESCPPHTISIENHKAVIHRKHCIRCFCCQEMCPVRAIRICTSWLKGGKS